MKTKELIRQLMEADPSGEEEGCVGNVDILNVGSLPAYYDGPAQVLRRDSTKASYYDVVGGKYKRTGVKIQIFTLPFSDAISNDHHFEVDYSELDSKQAEATKAAHTELREWYKQLDTRCEWQYFLRWVKAQVVEADHEDLEQVSREFFDKHVTPDDPLPRRRYSGGAELCGLSLYAVGAVV